MPEKAGRASRAAEVGAVISAKEVLPFSMELLAAKAQMEGMGHPLRLELKVGGFRVHCRKPDAAEAGRGAVRYLILHRSSRKGKMVPTRHPTK